MGQYYKPISIDRKQYLYMHKAGKAFGMDFCGLKLMEHSWMKNPIVNAVCLLLSEGNAWYKTRIVWAGDYADKTNELVISVDGSPKPVNYYDYAREKFSQVNPKETLPRIGGYVINHTKNEFVNLKKTPKDSDGWQIHALPLLTADGNGRGGGDFRDEDPDNLVGRWAYDVLSFQTTKPKGKEFADFEEIDFNLTE